MKYQMLLFIIMAHYIEAMNSLLARLLRDEVRLFKNHTVIVNWSVHAVTGAGSVYSSEFVNPLISNDSKSRRR